MIGQGLDIVKGAGYNSYQVQVECEEVAGDQPRVAGADLRGADLRGAKLTEAAMPDGSIYA
ncbi:MAG: pentapeptide repeat-containing protein [Ardenticatenia bacterium]|nr:pentapeptide repeat-containing protein [Ardenticatenia bacterium]